MRNRRLSLTLLAASSIAWSVAVAPATAQDPTPAMAHAHAHDTPTATAAVSRPLGPEKVTAEAVVYGKAGGEELHGFLARPAQGARGGPGLILIHEWWGLNDNLREMARQFASHGYAALAVDLYHGKVATDPDQAQTAMKETMARPAVAADNLRQAQRYLHDTVGAARAGVVGWCFGGGWALQTGLLLPDQIQAVVMYYGAPEKDRAELAKLKAPLLAFYGDQDQAFPPATVGPFEALLHELHKDASVHVFPGAAHGFANPSGRSYAPAAADEAWRLTLEFLHRHLLAKS